MNYLEAEDFLLKQYNVPRGTFLLIKKYHDSLTKWNKIIHLISNNESGNLWERHIIDSAQLGNLLKNSSDKILLDIGSGTGFPAIILSLMCNFKEVHLIESNEKKAIFLEEMARLSSNKIIIHNKRIDEAVKINADIITARAFAKLDIILHYSLMHGAKDHLTYSFKGIEAENELEKSKIKWDFEYNKFPSDILNDSFILEVKNCKEKNE